jgi:hypothetical protein
MGKVVTNNRTGNQMYFLQFKTYYKKMKQFLQSNERFTMTEENNSYQV